VLFITKQHKLLAHRLSTIISSDQIVVLDAGTIAGIGTHEDLLQTCAIYKKLYENQYGDPEPAVIDDL